MLAVARAQSTAGFHIWIAGLALRLIPCKMREKPTQKLRISPIGHFFTYVYGLRTPMFNDYLK